MKTVIGILIGVALVLAFQKLMNEGDRTESATTSTSQNISESSSNIPESFIDFYTKFHADSVFQMENINFPLKGLPANADSLMKVENKFFWKKEDWAIHHPFDEANGSFTKKMVKVSDLLIEEIIQIKLTNQFIQRRFYKSANGWKLIYYSAPNDTPKKG